MNRHRFSKAIAAAAATMLALSMFGAVGVSAAQPNWDVTVTKLPLSVSPTADAGYRLFIVNNGPSNISALYLNDSVIAPATYLAGQRTNLCQTSPVLFCAFGALNAGASITLTVAHTSPGTGSGFTVSFALNTTGASFNDKGKNSHGDTLVRTVTTGLSGDQNFAGGFVQAAGSTVANGSSLSRRNIQSTKAIVNATNSSGIPVTVEDGSGITFACIGCAGTPLGEWSDISVAEGTPVEGLIHITITVYSKNVPNHINLNNVIVYHTNAAGTATETIDTQCGESPTANCLTATLLGNGDLQIDVYVDHNGGLRGTLK